MTRKSIFTLMAMAIVLWVTPGSAFGQVDQGTITGVVQDTSGAVVGNATVALTSLDTGLELTTKADGGGVYVFSPLKIGNYKITVKAPGLRPPLRPTFI